MKQDKNNIITWLTLILLAPVGIFLMWKDKKYSITARMLLTVVFIIWFVFIGINGITLKERLHNSENKSGTKQGIQVEDPKIGGTSVKGELKISYIDVGQADSILIQQGNEFMLIDAGNNGDGEIVKEYLTNQGVKELQCFIGTHKDEDHIGGADVVINSFKVGKVYFPKQKASTETYKDFVSAVKNKGLTLTVPRVGEQFKLGEAEVMVLAPNSGEYEDSNDYSIVLKVIFGSTTFLLTGDAEALSEKEMVSSGRDLSAAVLKVGHHGSGTSTSPAFLDKVNPMFAVVSVGTGNKYGHPALETMNRLKAKGIKVFRTDEQKIIVLTSNGKDINFNVSPGSYKGITK